MTLKDKTERLQNKIVRLDFLEDASILQLIEELRRDYKIINKNHHSNKIRYDNKTSTDLNEY